MSKLKNFLKPRIRLARGTRLTSGLFIGASLVVAAGILFAANMYYNIDTGTVMVEERQQITGTFTATTTMITAATSTGAALTVTQTVSSGYGAIITGGNVGIGTTTPAGLFTVATTTGPALLYVDRSSGNVGISTSTPSALLAVAGNIIGSGNLILYGTNASSTFAAPIEIPQIRITGGAPVATYVLTATDNRGNATWQSAAGFGPWTEAGTYIYPTNYTVRTVAIATSTTRSDYDLDVWGDFAVGTSTAWDIPAFYIDSGTGGKVGIGTTTVTGLFTVGTTTPSLVVAANGYVGIATTTPSQALTVQGTIFGPGPIILYGTTATSTFGAPIEATRIKLTNPAPTAAGYVLTATDTSGNAAWLATSGITPSNWNFVSVNAISPTSTNIGIIVNASSTFNITGTDQFRVGSAGQFYIDASGNATTTGNIYASAFISTGANAYTRKSGEEIIRGVVPIFGFDLPSRCKTSCNSGTATATVSRVIENNDDIFPTPYTGTTRKYRFSIRYADATTTASTRTTWDVATSSDPTYTSRFTLPPSTSADLAQGFTTTTNQVTLPTTDNWFLRVSTGHTGNYDLQVYDILLIGLDQVN